MSWEVILEILKWLAPVGFLSPVAVWLTSRFERELKRIKASHDAYKLMYEDLTETVKEDINEKKKLRTMVGRLERALSKIYGCRHYPNCPVDVELQHIQTDVAKPQQRNNRQPRNKGDSGGNSRDSPRIEGGDGDNAGEPP